MRFTTTELSVIVATAALLRKFLRPSVRLIKLDYPNKRRRQGCILLGERHRLRDHHPQWDAGLLGTRWRLCVALLGVTKIGRHAAGEREGPWR